MEKFITTIFITVFSILGISQGSDTTKKKTQTISIVEGTLISSQSETDSLKVVEFDMEKNKYKYRIIQYKNAQIKVNRVK